MAVDLFSVTVGSRAFGLATADSDYDVRIVRAQTAADLVSPYPMDDTQAPELDPGTFGPRIETQALDYGKFIRNLAASDLNAWIVLMSDMVESGRSAQTELRELAVTHLLDTEALREKAQRRAIVMLHEARFKGSGKIAANGLAYFVFAINMGAYNVLGNHALDLGTYRDVLRELKFNLRPINPDDLLAELEQTELVYVRRPDPERSYVNMRFLDYYRRWVE